jgi:hypothetical protein
MASLISKDIRPNQRLAASILRSPAGLLMNDHERNAELTEAIYERLGLKQPAKLESEYTDGKSYHDALASLVVEETRFTIVSELQKRFSLKNRTAKSQASGVSIQVTGGERHFYEAWTREPLSSSDRNSFKAGAVFMMVPRGEDHDPKRMVLGTIQYGSKVTRICKCLAIETALTRLRRMTNSPRALVIFQYHAKCKKTKKARRKATG